MDEASALKVLIIEDDKATRQTFRAALEAGGCIVAEAARGDIGVELAKRFNPSVIVLDLLLPGLKGEAVVQELKLDVLTADIAIVVVSVVSPQSAGLPLQAIAAHIVKPAAGDYVLKAVRQAAATRARPR